MRWKQPWKSEARAARGVLLAELKRLRGRVSALEQASAPSDEAGAARSEAGEDTSPEWFRVIVAHSADIFGELDGEGRLLYLSPNVREITGAEPDEFVGGNALVLVHPDDLERAARGIERARSGSASVTVRYRLKDDSWGWFETVARPYRNRDGELRIVFVARNMTDRVRAEDALIASEARLEHLVTASPAVIYTCEPGGSFASTYVSENVVAHAGFAASELMEDHGLWTSRIHPEDWKRIRAESPRLFEQGHYAHEYRFLHKDGSYRWFQDQMRLVRDASGRPLEIVGFVMDVTERMHALKALRESEERYRTVSELSSDFSYCIRLEPDGSPVFQWVTEAYRRITSYDPSQVAAHEWELYTHPDDHATVREHAKRVFAGEAGTAEWRLFTRDGEVRWLRERSRVTTDEEGRVCWYGASQDITELKRAESALRESEERFRQLAENTRSVSWLSKADLSEILYASPAYETIWGRAVQELYEDPDAWMESIHPDDRGRVEEVWRQKAAAGGFDVEYRIARPDGSLRWIHDRGFPIRDAAGEVYRISGVAEDITDRKQAEETRRRVDRLEALGTLAAGLAHQVDDPLGSIRAAADYALKIRQAAGADGELTALLEGIASQARRCGEIVSNVLSFASDLPAEKWPADLNCAVRRAGDRTRAEARKRGATLSLDLSEALPRVRMNPSDVEQAVVHLIHNAMDAGDAVRVTLHTEATPEGVRLSVSDDGEGIEPGVVDRIFDPFFGTRESEGGSGLGLSVVHGVVVDHGGRIRVDSEPGAGTAVTIDLPLSAEPRGGGQLV
ncbi:MAG: PAS domain-containing protein [Myxococcota bacterium]